MQQNNNIYTTTLLENSALLLSASKQGKVKCGKTQCTGCIASNRNVGGSNGDLVVVVN